MPKRKLIFISLVVAAAIVPYFLFAQSTPAVTSFSVNGAFVPGSVYSVTLGNVPNLTSLKPSVTLDGKALSVTGTTANSISGKLSDGISKKGGSLKIKYKDTEVIYPVYAPYIESIFLPKAEKDGQMIISGGNFSDTSCNATITNSSFTVTSCNQRMVFIKLGNKLNGGEITVKNNGITSAPFKFDFTAPAIVYADNKDGIAPNANLTIHAKGLSSAINENVFTLDSVYLPINIFKPKDGIVQVTLPQDNAKGALKLTVNGIESNTLNVDSSSAPILIDYKKTEDAKTITIIATGRNFSADSAKTALSIGGKNGTVLLSNINTIEAQFPKQGYSGCLQVTVYGQISNCLPFNTINIPVLKGYLDPISNPSENTYEITLYGENLSDKTEKISAYVNSTKAEIKNRFMNQLIVKFTAIPDKGEIYLISDGIESNRMNYDFGERFYPYILSLSSNGKFMYAQPVSIKGTNLGQSQFKKDVTVNVSGVSIAKIEDTNSLDITVSPSEIVARLDDKVKAGTKATISVSVKGKKSNELSFVTGQENKNSLCRPWIQKVQYPEGIKIGSKIHLIGQCFNPTNSQNLVYFDNIAVKPEYSTASVIDVKIPKGAKEKGKIKVLSIASESNQADYISQDKTANSFSFSFDKTSSATAETGKEITLGKLQIENTIGEVEMQTMKFKVVYEDDKNNPNSYIKLGPLPFSDVKISFSGEGSRTIPNAIIERTGTDSFIIALHGIRVIPSLKLQTLEFKATIKPFALDGAKFHIEFDPAKKDNFSGVLIKGAQREILKISQKAISGPVTAIIKKITTCIDSDKNNANCPKATSGAPKK